MIRGCCVLLAKSLGVKRCVVACLQTCTHFLIDLLLLIVVSVCDKKQSNTDLPLIFKLHTQTHAHAHVRTHTHTH